MKNEDLQSLIEAYSKVHEASDPKKDIGARMGNAITSTLRDVATGTGKDISSLATTGRIQNTPERQRISQGFRNFTTSAQNVINKAGGYNTQTSAAKPSNPPKPSATNSSGSATLNALNKPGVQNKFIQDKKSTIPKPPTGGSGTPTAAAKPSSVVLAKQGGVEGKLDKATGKFTAGKFSGAEKARYTQYSPKPAASSQTGDKAKDMATWAKANPTLAKNVTPSGTQKGTGQSQMSKDAAELRDMQRASQMRQKGADVTGANLTSVRQSLQNAPNSPAPTGSAYARAQQMINLKKPNPNLKFEDLDIFDLVKGHLLDEGYAETEQSAIVIMANMSEEWRESIIEEIQQLDEISLKTKMKAYAASRDVDADYAYGSKVHDQGDRIKANIVKKHGEKAGEHAERHADVSNFGRKDASGKYKGLPKSRIEKSDYRTTASGKMHKQDQSELKRELRIRRGKKLRAADADDDN